MDGLPKDVFPAGMTALKGNTKFFDSLDEAVRIYAKDRETGLEIRGARTFILAALKREKKSLVQTIRKITIEKTEKEEPELLEKKGNTLLAFMHLINRGMSIVELPDIYGEGKVRIDLDPAVSAQTNIERYFNRARKFRESVKHTAERLRIMNERLSVIGEEISAVEKNDDQSELKKKAAHYERIMTRSDGDVEQVQEFPKRFRSVSGLEIVIGRNDKENDALLHWAKKNDLWFHAQGVAGSHVVMRIPGKQDPDRRSIGQAAAAAAFNSKARTSALVPVVYTLLKYVVKRKGQGPRTGYLHQRKSYICRTLDARKRIINL